MLVDVPASGPIEMLRLKLLGIGVPGRGKTAFKRSLLYAETYGFPATSTRLPHKARGKFKNSRWAAGAIQGQETF